MDLIRSYAEDLKLIRKTGTKAWLGVFIATILLLPLWAPEHLVYTATLAIIFAVGVLGQNLLIGYTGQISFGQAGFLCIGAYAFAHFSHLGLPWFLALAGAGCINGLVGLI